MNLDNLSKGGPPENPASPDSSESQVDISPEQSGKNSSSRVVGPSDHFVLNLDSDSASAVDVWSVSLDKTVPLHDKRATMPESSADLEGRLLGRFRLQKEIARDRKSVV